MTPTPAKMRQEAAQGVFAGPLDKKVVACSAVRSMERRQVARQKETAAIQTPMVKMPEGRSSSKPTTHREMFRANTHRLCVSVSAAAPGKVALRSGRSCRMRSVPDTRAVICKAASCAGIRSRGASGARVSAVSSLNRSTARFIEYNCVLCPERRPACHAHCLSSPRARLGSARARPSGILPARPSLALETDGALNAVALES